MSMRRLSIAGLFLVILAALALLCWQGETQVHRKLVSLRVSLRAQYELYGPEGNGELLELLESPFENQDEEDLPPPHKGDLKLDDLIVAIPINTERLRLVSGTRHWRRGVRTLFASNETVESCYHKHAAEHGEVFSVYPDDVPLRSKWPGDSRAALVPSLANLTFGVDSYKWLLYGDDDTVFFLENVLDMLEGLDHNMPYLLSDALWFYDGETGEHFHPHPLAPRCLPCNYTDPGGTPGEGYFEAPKGCPCTPELLCESDTLDLFSKPDCSVKQSRKGNFGVGRFFNIHGGSGAILSAGLMRAVNFQELELCVKSFEKRALGGDAMLFQCLWMLGYAATDPGYGFFRKGVQMFDPGPASLKDVTKLFDNWRHHTCDELCEEKLAHTLSLHIRGRKQKDFETVANIIKDLSGKFDTYAEERIIRSGSGRISQ